MIIKNSEYLLNISDSTTRELRKIILDLLEVALQSIDVKNLIANSVRFEGDLNLNNFNNVYVLGFGKACGGMAEEIEKILGPENIKDGIIVVPRNIKETLNIQKIKIFEADHPTPTKLNIEASNRILEIIKRINKESNLVIVLISGGGSALLTLPCEGISLKDIQQLTSLLLKSGANIKEINIVRKHCDKFKGGQLAKLLYPATVFNLLISDVGKHPPEFIASGPTFPDQSTYQDAFDILKKFGLLEKAPNSILKHINKGIGGKIEETPKGDEPFFFNSYNIILADSSMACNAIYSYAVKQKITPFIYPDFIEGEAREVGQKLVDYAEEIYLKIPDSQKPMLIIAGGETTVTVRGSGKGGRCQELILSIMEKLNNFEHGVMAAIGTDGIDGNSDAAGAIIDNMSLSQAMDMDLKIEKYLNNNDSFTFFKKLNNNLIYTGLTGTNISDIVLILLN